MGAVASAGHSTNQGTAWAWLSVIPMGLGAWAPAYAGVKAQNRRWLALGVIWSLIAVAGWVAAVTSNGDSGLAGGLIILGWVGAVATSFTIRPAYARQLQGSFDAAVLGAQERLAERERARRLRRASCRRVFSTSRPPAAGGLPRGARRRSLRPGRRAG